MIVSVHQPQYLPWLGYFDKIAKSDCFVFLDCVQYKVREFQNRNKIRTQNKWIWLTVPVMTKGQGRQPIAEVLVDKQAAWGKQHLRSLETWYGNAKFFDRYVEFFKEYYAKPWDKLMDLNLQGIRFFLKDLGITTKIIFESELKVSANKTDRIIAICQSLNADTYLSGIGGREYLEEEKFRKAGIILEYQNFTHPHYTQQFMEDRDDFVPYMSIVDLLFNEGPNSKCILGLA